MYYMRTILKASSSKKHACLRESDQLDSQSSRRFTPILYSVDIWRSIEQLILLLVIGYELKARPIKF